MLFLRPSVVPAVAQPLLPALLDVGSGMLGLFYACVIMLLVQRTGWSRRLGGLAAVGRLALTNYLLQTVLVTTLLYGSDAGLYGRLGIITRLPVALLIFILQFPPEPLVDPAIPIRPGGVALAHRHLRPPAATPRRHVAASSCEPPRALAPPTHRTRSWRGARLTRRDEEAHWACVTPLS